MVERASAFHHRRLQGEQPIKHSPSTIFPPYFHMLPPAVLSGLMMGELSFTVPPHCQGVEAVTQVVIFITIKWCYRPASKSNQLQPTVMLAASPPSVLSLQVLFFNSLSLFCKSIFQLEGAYGRACSVKETGVGKCDDEEERVVGLNNNLGLNPVSLSGSREDTVSPMASQRTGNLSSIAMHCVQII